MKKIEVFLLSTLVCLMMSCVPTAPARKISSNAELPVRGDTKSLVSGNTEFALDLYSKLKQKDGNIFFSPYSISAAMGMIYAGARGETETQMAKTLKFSSDQQHLHPVFTELDIELSKLQDSNVRVSVANSLWPQKRFKFSDDYSFPILFV